MPDLSPTFPLPRRGDRVLVVPYGFGPAETERWGRVTAVDTGPGSLYPVVVQFGDGQRVAYQQQEILGWRPSRLRLIWGRLHA